jgi:hypothetical protein
MTSIVGSRLASRYGRESLVLIDSLPGLLVGRAAIEVD